MYINNTGYTTVFKKLYFFVLYHLTFSGNLKGQKFGMHAIFCGLIFGALGIFWGFVGSPKDFFGS